MKKNKQFVRGSDGGKKTVELYGKEHMRKLAKKRWAEYRKQHPKRK